MLLRKMLSLNYIIIQVFLVVFWGIFQVNIARAVPIPGMQIIGMECLRDAVFVLFFLLWGIIGFRWIWETYGKTSIAWILETLGIAFFIGAVIWIDSEPLWYGLNSSGDHMMQYTLATLTECNLFHFGRLGGWCSTFGAGFPLNDLYPPGGFILYCLLRILSLGFIAGGCIYTYTVFFSYLTFSFVLYGFVRKNFGLISALLLLLLLLLDDGMHFGWRQFFHIGMWGSGLGLALAFYAYWTFSKPDRLRTYWHGPLLAAAFGFSILLHPLFLFTHALWITLHVITRFLNERCFINERSDPESGAQGLKILWSLCGIGLAAFWWLPFALSRDWIIPFGYIGRDFPDVGKEIWDGNLYNASAVHVTLGVVGILCAVFSRRRAVFLLGLFSIINIFAGSEIARHIFSFSFLESFFSHMQGARLIGAAKIASMILGAGYCGRALQHYFDTMSTESTNSVLLRSLGAFLSLQSSPFQFRRLRSDLCAAGLLLVLLCPLVYIGKTTLCSGWRWRVTPRSLQVGSIPRVPSYWNSFVDAVQVINARERSDAPAAFFQEPLYPVRALTYDSWRMISEPAFGSAAIAGPYYIPTMLLYSRPKFIFEQDLDLTNVKYVFDWKVSPFQEVKSLKGLETVYENNEIILYQRDAWTGQGWTLSGSGSVRLTDSSTNGLQFQIDGSGADSFLRIGISRYRKWKAYLNGEPVQIFYPPKPGETPEALKFIGVELQDGVLELRYQLEWFDLLGFWISVGSLGVCAALCSRRLTLPPFIWYRIDLIEAGLQTVFAVGLIGVMIISGMGSSPLRENYLHCIGQLGDRIGLANRDPDGIRDICFQLDLVPDEKNGKIIGITLQLIRPDGSARDHAIWSVRDGEGGWIAVSDVMGRRFDYSDYSFQINPHRFYSLLLFVPNTLKEPFWVPAPASCTLYYENGEQVTIRSDD